ncbi:MAG: homocysteine S-methyltransferase family protein [Anaerolineae bacterium]|nr:homocysteine S-methyltransferase family protein [Anaerolineae bacterium]
MNLAEFLSKTERPILLDGAMGTQLAVAGLEMGGQNSVTHPDAVLAVHRQYVDSGIDLLITNTLTMNRVAIESHNVGVDVREVNLAGAKLARSAVREGQYVLGDISATGKMLAPLGDLSAEDAYAAYEEQASLLAEGGVDGFIIETMIDLQETLCALRACRAVADLPVLVSLAFKTTRKGARTLMGNSPQDCAKALAEAGAFAVGANCGELDPLQMAETVPAFREACDLPILIQPNAGKPELIGGQTVFRMTPSEFALGVHRCVEAGAQLVGGCCGTSPAHIRAVADLLKGS